MTAIKIPVLTPIRFYNPNLAFDNESTFQNPDNRVSTGYDHEGVNPIQYALPIPKQWPDGQPGIDFIVQVDTLGAEFYADLYDFDDVYYKSLLKSIWEVVGTEKQHRVFLDGISGSGIADGYYTIKLFDTTDDALLFESEALLIADWFVDAIPFEYWNFENDFGIVWDNGSTRFTGRIMVPVRLYDPEPTFEKEVYKNDPGELTTLRSIPQRVFNFDSLPVPVHVAELFQLAFACSELYLDRIKINSDDMPESELIEGTNLKQLNGKATFVDFNDQYMREKVETALTDQSIDWASHTYVTAVITANSIVVDDAVVSGVLWAQSQSYAHVADELVLIKVVLTDDSGDDSTDLPLAQYGDAGVTLKEWGTNWLSYRTNDAASDYLRLVHFNNQKAVYTAVITFYSVG